MLKSWPKTPGANGITSRVSGIDAKTTIGARVKIGTSTPSGVKSSLARTLRPCTTDMNVPYGPDRVGPYGTFMSVVHGLKVLAKEDFTPLGVDVPIFTLAPIVVFASIPLTLLVIPFAPGVFGQDFNIALLYFFAIGGMSVVGLMIAGWASFNKYSLLGALRAE